jgi:hypothetical protein
VIDMVVNANVLLYLGECRETAVTVAGLNQVIDRDAESDSYWYYLDPLALYHAIARAYAHGAGGLLASRDAVIRKIRSRQKANGSFGDELLTGLALCALLDFGARDDTVERAIGHLLRVQLRRGSWPRRAFYGGPEPPGPHAIWWAAEAMTTAVCLEGLVKSLDASARMPGVAMSSDGGPEDVDGR